jgi:hypothetical protein
MFKVVSTFTAAAGSYMRKTAEASAAGQQLGAKEHHPMNHLPYGASFGLLDLAISLCVIHWSLRLEPMKVIYVIVRIRVVVMFRSEHHSTIVEAGAAR